MSGHADTIRRALDLDCDGCIYDGGGRLIEIASGCAIHGAGDSASVALDALEATLVEQADRIAWLEGDVAGWRIKLAECEEESKRLRSALTEIATFPISEDLSAGYHFAEVRSIARAAIRLPKLAECEERQR